MRDSDRRFAGNRYLVPFPGKGGLPEIHLGATGAERRQMFLSDPGDEGARWRLKWLASTCLAGCVGVCVIGITVYASMNIDDGRGVVSSIKRASAAAMAPVEGAQMALERQTAAGQKTDRIEVTSLGLATRHIIHDTVVQQRGNRDYIGIKPYARVVARLSTAQPDDVEDIPPFNPFKLFSNPTPIADGTAADGNGAQPEVTIHVQDLADGLPAEDGLELRAEQALELIAEANELLFQAPYAMRTALLPDGEQPPIVPAAYRPDEPFSAGLGAADGPGNITVVEKADTDDEILEGREVRSVTIRRGDTLMSVLEAAGAERWQARSIVGAMAAIFPPTSLQIGQEVRYTLAPAPSDTGQLEPIKVSIFTGDQHHVTVVRDGTGDYAASDDPIEADPVTPQRAERYPQRATLYTSFYHSARSQGLSHDMITQLLRVHSHDVDFKRPSRAGDAFEVFFDLRESPSASEGEPGELLYTAMTVDGERREFYRFRTPDGVVDFYDGDGNSARTFLLRRPVRGGRLTSSYGMRNHPLLRYSRMHLGTDWAAPRGTPIMAAAAGVVESVERRPGYGNYVRIRHANGYKTAYAHMHGFAEGLGVGVKVEQGQIIGQVGSTGLSTGPHLHFEVLVNNRHVDPMTIHVPRGRQLTGRELADFVRERNRIDELMQRSPVTTRVASISQQAR